MHVERGTGEEGTGLRNRDGRGRGDAEDAQTRGAEQACSCASPGRSDQLTTHEQDSRNNGRHEVRHGHVKVGEITHTVVTKGHRHCVYEQLASEQNGRQRRYRATSPSHRPGEDTRNHGTTDDRWRLRKRSGCHSVRNQ
jgi:hypothetical protein